MMPFDLPPKPTIWIPAPPAIIRAASLQDIAPLVAMPLMATFASASARGFRSNGAKPATTGTFGNAESTTRTWGIGSGAGDFMGFSFVAPATGVLSSVKIRSGATWAAGNLKAQLYSNSAGSPGTQIGSDSDSIAGAINSDLTNTFASPPSISSGVTYWIVWTATGTGDRIMSCCTDTAGYGSGRNNTITSITDSLGVEWRVAVNYTA